MADCRRIERKTIPYLFQACGDKRRELIMKQPSKYIPDPTLDEPAPLEPVPAGVSHREYWKRVSEQAHQFPDDFGPYPEETPPQLPADENKPQPARRRLPRLRLGPPFWTITGILSLVVNVVLIGIVITLASQIFSLKSTLETQLLGGLNNNFGLMDQAHIKTTIPISTTVPAKFDLPVSTNTTVTLQKDVLIKKARVVSLVSGGVSIVNAPTDILLPAGTQLPITLNITVPVDQQIPVNLTVAVDIPLDQTDLHAPFVGLQNVVGPYINLLQSSPNTLEDALCGTKGSDLCKNIVP